MNPSASASPVRKISVCEPLYLGKEAEYALEAVRSGWISSSGPYLREFEEKFSAFCGVRYGVAATSGTAALHLALRALQIKEGDEVIIPDFTMVAVLFSVLYCGAKPVLVDADPETWNLDPSRIERSITPKTKAIIAVHTYGHPCDMDPILKLAQQYKLSVVEDAAEAHGATYRDRVCGGMGDLGVFSFYANKIITTGEGGMVVTDDLDLADRCRYYKNLCFSLKGPRDFMHEDVGYNYRMTNVQAAIGVAQLENIQEFIKRRRANAALYTKMLNKVPGMQCPAEKSYAKNVYWMYGVVLNPDQFGMTRDELCRILGERGVETRFFFKPMHRQKMMRDLGGGRPGDYPVSNRLADHGFYLPSGSGLTRDDIEHICGLVREYAASRSARG